MIHSWHFIIKRRQKMLTFYSFSPQEVVLQQDPTHSVLNTSIIKYKSYYWKWAGCKKKGERLEELEECLLIVLRVSPLWIHLCSNLAEMGRSCLCLYPALQDHVVWIMGHEQVKQLVFQKTDLPGKLSARQQIHRAPLFIIQV